MQSVSSRIWTRVAVFISYDDNHYPTGTSTSLFCLNYVLLHTSCDDFQTFSHVERSHVRKKANLQINIGVSFYTVLSQNAPVKDDKITKTNTKTECNIFLR